MKIVRRPSIRALRLVSGLTLFGYVATHLLNHALGNVSVGAMEAGLLAQKFLWQGVVGTAALYGALATHYGLGLWAAYQRRHFGWTRAEIVQVTLGLSIPFLLLNHLFVTRIALAQFGLEKGYAQELYSFWVAAPDLGVLQVTVLIVAWIHGCIGVGLWLRQKPIFERIRAALLCAAIILPLLALLGFFQGGRAILALATDPRWQAANLAPFQVGLPPQNAALRRERDISLLAALGLLGVVGLARLARAWREQHSGTVRVSYPDGRQSRIPLGFSVLEASRVARIPHASICGGRARCSTCRVRVIASGGALPLPAADEQALIERHGFGPLVRLACQLRPLADVSVVPLLTPDWPPARLRARQWPLEAEERFIVVLVADMRDSTRLARTRLPFDTVFIVDRFVAAIGAAVRAAGGRANHFTGDGLMAMFGLACEPALACRQALDAVALIGFNVARLNAALVAERGEPIRFGIGVHGSTAVVGEIGYAESRVFTSLGDAANVATRVEAACKTFGCEAVVSEEVCALSGYDVADLPRYRVPVRGLSDPLWVRAIGAIGTDRAFATRVAVKPA